MVEKESDRERKRGTWPRRNSGDRMWCSEGFVFFFFLQSFAICCVESTLLSVSPWPMVKSTSRRTRYNAKSVWGKGQSVEITSNGRESGDHFRVSQSTTRSRHLPQLPSMDPGIQASPVPPLSASVCLITSSQTPRPTFPKLCHTLCSSTSAWQVLAPVQLRAESNVSLRIHPEQLVP